MSERRISEEVVAGSLTLSDLVLVGLACSILGIRLAR
jgi:hypothetical protein